MKSTKLLKTNKNKTKTKTINNHNKLKGGSNNNDILSLFIPNNPLVKTKIDSKTKENIEFIKNKITDEASSDYFESTVNQLFTSYEYFNDLIKQNYNAGIEKHKTLQKMDNNNVKIVISLHGQTQSGIFKLPDNVNVVFMSPVSYISCSPPGRILNYLDNSDNLENFLKNPSCFNKNKTDSFFNQSVIVYGGQYCIDLLLSREAALGGITLSGNKEHVTGIHINNGKNFINKNTESNIESQKFKDLGIPESPNLSKDEFPEGVVNGIVYFDNNNPKESSLGLLSNFLPHFFSNENNNKKQFTIFFTSCRELDDQANKETLSFYEKTLKYLNFKIQYDNNKTKSKNINEEYTKCFSAPTIFSNDTTKSNTTGIYQVKYNTISHGQERKTKEQIKLNKTNTKTKSKSRIKPTINDDSIIEISNLHYGYDNSKYKTELNELLNNITAINDKKQITLKKLKEFITNKHQDDIFKLLFILLSLCFQKSIFEYDANSFDYRILDFIELTKFILNGESISIIFEFIIYFANELKLNKISYIELINLFIDQTPQLSSNDIKKILDTKIPGKKTDIIDKIDIFKNTVTSAKIISQTSIKKKTLFSKFLRKNSSVANSVRAVQPVIAEKPKFLNFVPPPPSRPKNPSSPSSPSSPSNLQIQQIPPTPQPPQRPQKTQKTSNVPPIIPVKSNKVREMQAEILTARTVKKPSKKTKMTRVQQMVANLQTSKV